MSVGLLVIGDGRKDKLVQAIESLEQNLVGDISARIMINDSLGESEGYHEFLVDRFPGYKVISQERLGLAGAIRTGWAALREVNGLSYVFHMEEDFTFNKKVYLNEMISILNSNEDLVQVSLKRDSVNPAEAAAGGFIQQRPELYTQKNGYVEQQNLFTLNPNMYSIDLLDLGWPEHGGESEFTSRVHNHSPNAKFGIFGSIEDEPLISHIGSHRSENWQL